MEVKNTAIYKKLENRMQNNAAKRGHDSFLGIFLKSSRAKKAIALGAMGCMSVGAGVVLYEGGSAIARSARGYELAADAASQADCLAGGLSECMTNTTTEVTVVPTSTTPVESDSHEPVQDAAFDGVCDGPVVSLEIESGDGIHQLIERANGRHYTEGDLNQIMGIMSLAELTRDQNLVAHWQNQGEVATGIPTGC